MENKLPPDRLDAFLQKMLEGYSPAPPDDIWADIEAELPPATPTVGATPKWPSVKASWWAAVAASLLGIIGFQYWHYNGQIEDLYAKLAHTQLRDNTLEAQPIESGGTAQIDSIQGALLYGRPKETNKKEEATQLAASRNTAANGKAHRPVGANPIARQYTDEQQAPSHMTASLEDAGNGKAVAQALPEPITTLKQTAEESAVLQGLPPITFIGAINRQYDLHSQPSGLTSSTPKAMTKVLKPRWTLKARAMPMHTRIQLSARPPQPDPSGPGGGGPGGGPGNDRNRVFADPEVIKGKMLAAGLMAEHSLAGRWTLSLGAELLRTEVKARHSADFEIRERDHHGGGHGHPPRPRHSHDFDYDLQTSAGLATVSLRVTEADTMRLLNEDETIQFAVNTRQRTTRAAFPVLLGYRLERSRWSIQPKLGLMAGFTFERSVDIASVSISGPDNAFEPRVSPVSQLDNRLTFGLDFVASMGLACRLTPGWEVGIEPTFMHSLGQWSGGPDASASALGIGTYVAYRF